MLTRRFLLQRIRLVPVVGLAVLMAACAYQRVPRDDDDEFRRGGD